MIGVAHVYACKNMLEQHGALKRDWQEVRTKQYFEGGPQNIKTLFDKSDMSYDTLPTCRPTCSTINYSAIVSTFTHQLY